MIRFVIAAVLFLPLVACAAQPEVSPLPDGQPPSIRAGILPEFYSRYPKVKRPPRILPPTESSITTATPGTRGFQPPRNGAPDEPEPSIRAIDEASEALDRVQRRLINTPKLD